MARNAGGGSRAASPLDRNPTDPSVTYGPTVVAPHALTSRWSYTVPAGRKASVNLLSLHVVRVTAAAPVGQVYGRIRVTPSGGSATLVSLCGTYGNAVDSGREMVEGASILLGAGDILDGFTVDLSTGGTVEYALAAAIKEYDA